MASEQLHLTDCVVDLALHQVQRADERVSLSRNEVALLRYLLRHPDAPVSKETLHAEVFGYAPTVVSRAADYTVHRLRRKLEVDPSAPRHLLTVPGVGYRLVAGPARPEAASVDVPESSLPAELTSFVGRSLELAQVVGLLGSGHRLVTITGPGGVGKTRLALRAAAAFHARSGRPVQFCALDQARDRVSVCAAVAVVLGVDAPLGDRPVVRLAGALAARGPLLLVLDNLEQVVPDAAAACTAWLRAAPDLRLLTTSRERLGVSGEQIWPLAPLGPAEATELFTDRSRLTRPGFGVADDEVDVVAELVDRLDGLPLAIELAAARSGAFTPRQLLDRFDAHGALGQPPRDVPQRQASVEQAIDWSWQLLSESERRVLCALTAFEGGFTIEDAEAVALVDPGEAAIGEIVQQLREKSLLDERPDRHSRRFGFLRAVRQFAERRAQETRSIWLRHARWVLDRASAPARDLAEAHDADAFEQLVPLHDDLQTAIRRLETEGSDPALLAELLLAARPTWHRSGSVESFLDRIDRAMEADLPRPLLARLHLAAADEGLWNRPAGTPRPTNWERVLDLIGDDEGLATQARLVQAAALRAVQRYDEAGEILDRLEEALEAQPVGIPHVRVAIERTKLDIFLRDYTSARARGLRGLALCDRIGHLALEGQLWQILATNEGNLGHHEEQARMARKSLLRAREVRERRMERRALYALALAETELGLLDQAAQHTRDGVAQSVAAHDVGLAHHTLMLQVEVDFVRGELDDVCDHLRRVTEHFHLPDAQWVNRVAMFSALVGWARWGSAALAAEELERATRLAREAQGPDLFFWVGKVLAARSYVEPDANEELSEAFDRLEDRARVEGKLEWLRSIALDRAHLEVAAAIRGAARGEEVRPIMAKVATLLQADRAHPWEPGSFAAAFSRVVLSSALAEVEVGRAVPDESALPGE